MTRRWRMTWASMRSTSNRCRWWAGPASVLRIRRGSIRAAYLAGVAKAFVALGGRIYEHSAADEFCENPRGVKANGHLVSVQGRRHRHAQSAGRLRRPGGRHPVSDEAGAVHELRDCRACGARRRPRRTLVGHGRSLPLSPRRAASGLRRGDLRWRDHKTGQQDDTEVCYRRLEGRLRASFPSRADASLVGSGDRDARWAAVHRPKRRPPILGYRILRQWSDVRNAGWAHHLGRHPRSAPIRGPSSSIRAERP